KKFRCTQLASLSMWHVRSPTCRQLSTALPQWSNNSAIACAISNRASPAWNPSSSLNICLNQRSPARNLHRQRLSPVRHHIGSDYLNSNPPPAASPSSAKLLSVLPEPSSYELSQNPAPFRGSPS